MVEDSSREAGEAESGPCDVIEIRGLRVEGVHGVLARERASAQAFEVDLDLFVDTRISASTDELADTVDYASVADVATSVLAGRPHRLLESLAAEIASRILEDRRVRRVTVALRKLRPPLAHDVDWTGVRLTRTHPRT